jgi:hypothetical protein
LSASATNSDAKQHNAPRRRRPAGSESNARASTKPIGTPGPSRSQPEIPTAVAHNRLDGMATRTGTGIQLVAVNPAYSSI